MSKNNGPLIKFCGTTSVADALLAQSAGADYIGVILGHPASPRNVDRDRVRAIQQAVSVPLVAVTVNFDAATLLEIWRDLEPAALQLHGDEAPQVIRTLKEHGLTVWKALSGESGAVKREARLVGKAGADALLIDARATDAGNTVYGGTGRLSDWSTARALVDSGYRVILAGGLSPDNVADAIAAVNPWMVDVISGVEAAKGTKDPAKLRAFMAAVHECP